MASPRQTDVLVVGAGPTGLVLALFLERQGIGVHVIDKAPEPGTTSRAIAVQARTLEHYQQVGLARQIVARGLEFAAVNLWVRGERVGRVAFGDIGRGLTPFPHVLSFPQEEHEALLIETLRRDGLDVERPSELIGLQERRDHVLARARTPDAGETEWQARYIVGCDGARSTVRELLGIGFPGGTYERVYYVADVELHGPVANHELHVAIDEADFVAVFPLKGEKVARLIGTVRPESEGEREIGWDDVGERAISRMRIAVDRVNWFSTYRVHHRVAERFRRGRAFLAGDAAHIHSPVGGQGMNTGIGDAVNLAWKLAGVVRERADPKLLDSYAPERRAFAERLVRTTDRAFTFSTRDGPIARRVRFDIIPALVPALMKRHTVRRFMFRTVSQTVVNYRRSELSAGKAGSVRGGDRLPWIEPVPGADDNYAPLASLDWQLHVYGKPRPELERAAERRGLPLHAFVFNPASEASGFARDAAYLVRPDGYVALADPEARPGRLERYLDEQGLRLTPA